MYKSLFFIVLLFLPEVSLSKDLTKLFPKGSGSKFKVYTKSGGEIDLSIYISNVEKTKVSIEYFMVSKSLLGEDKLWQQFELNFDTTLQLKKGYILSPKMKNPENIPDVVLEGDDGLKVNDFLFSNPENLKKLLVKVEKIKLPAGETKAYHYRRTNNDHTVDFWISDEAKPIGLVKLISKSETKKKHNYTIFLSSIVKNVKPVIDPSKSVPLSKEGKRIFSNVLDKK
jgi:hypothetical protein